MVTLEAREGHDAEVRRDGVERLAAATRALADAIAVTAVDRATLAEVSGAIEMLTHRLSVETDGDGYSGLLVLPVDPARPETYMPLNPIIGNCNPSRPDVEVRIADGAVVGTATFTRRFVGPAGHAHGGISAMLADQLVAAAPMAIGVRTVTKSLTVRYLRALPLDEELELWGECTPDGEQYKAKFEVRARGEVAVAGTGVLVPYQNLAKRAGITRAGTESQPSGVKPADG
jgi:acyl-coenzyme A thioesterase PaaI-like protein